MLAIVVIATTVAGFSVLTELFDSDRRGTMTITPYGSEGAIVTCGDATGQVCRIDAQALARGATDDDLVRLTDFSDVLLTALAVSPDGRTVVFERHRVGAETDRIETAELWTMGVDGTGLRRLTTPGTGFIDPSWSTRGLIVAVAGDVASPGAGPASLVILDPSADTTAQVRRIDLPGLSFPSSPQWAPDGDRILFHAKAGSVTDLYTIDADGTQLTNITNSNQTEFTPRLSPDGRSIAFWVGSPDGVEIRVCPLECVDPRPLSDPDGRPIQGAFPEWSPDGNWIAFVVETGPGADLHVARIDGSDERTLVSGVGEIAWIPVVAHGSTPQPQPEPEGRDIGLDFNLCHVERFGGIDFLGDRSEGQAWSGVPANEDGSCPRYPQPGAFVVAEDHTGDDRADSWLDLPWRCDVGCAVWDATDLDGNGTDELIVAGFFSIMDHHVLGLQPDADGKLLLQPYLVAEPGHEPAGLIAGEPLRIDAGGDEGYSSAIWCDNYPDDPVIVWAWVLGIVETDQPQQVHITRLKVQSDGMVHVIGTNDYTIPASEDWGYGDQTEPACGVDFHPAA